MNRLKKSGIVLFIGTKNSLLHVLLFSCLVSHAQQSNFIREINPFEITYSSNFFSNIFSGGLNNPEFQFVDIDNDDDFDLFILNSDGTFEWFENKGNKFLPSFELSSSLPAGLYFYDWFFFVDIDADNDYDLFTGLKGSKVSYFKNIGSVFNPLFQLEVDTVKNILGNSLNVESGSNPAFVDIDTDGDYDLIGGNTSGTANYYENIGTASQFLFDSLESEWQNLRVGLGKTIGTNKHGASSIDFIDIDNNGTLDLFWGDLFNTSLYLIRNTGTPSFPEMKIESRVYPLNSDSISTKGFNMPRFVDIDADNNLDLFSSVLWNDISTFKSIAFRRNNGGNNFEYRGDNFLNLLDVGSRSVPNLVDIDGDGDLDLFVGSESLDNGSIFFFKNIGTAGNPSFTLIDSSYCNIRGDLSLSPTFGDLDADGDYDLLVGNYFNDIIYYENEGDRFNPIFVEEEILKNRDGQDLSAGIYSRCKLTDVDFDNDLDLVVGNFSGNVLLFENVGTRENYSFELNEEYFNIIKPGNYTNPTYVDYDNDGINELFVGTDSGNIFLFENDDNISPNFTLVENNFLDFDLGREPNLFFADIENDGDEDLFIGNIKGGLYFYRNGLISSIDDKELINDLNLTLKTYPNPFNGNTRVQVSVPNNLYFSLRIFNILGEEVSLLYSGTSTGEVQTFIWNTNSDRNVLSSGTYIIAVQTNDKAVYLPVILLK